MIAVSNTSPMMALSKIGYVAYLHELFERVFISESVKLEISKKDNEVWHATKEMIEKGFIEVKTVKNINCCNHLSCGQKRFPLFELVFALEFKPQDLILEPWYFQV